MTVTTARVLPPEWHRGVPERFAPVLLALGLVLGVFGVTLALASSDLTAAMRVVTVCFFGVFVAALALALKAVLEPRRDGEIGLATVTIETQELKGVAFPMRARWAFLAFVALMTGLTVAGLLFSVLSLWRSDVDISGGGVVGLIVLGTLALLMPYLLYRMYGARLWRPTAIVLTPTHVVSTWAHPDTAVPWDDVAGVHAKAIPIGLAFPLSKERLIIVTATELTRVLGLPERAKARRPLFGGQPGLVIAVRSSGADPVLMLDALRFYLAHPDKRRELGGATGVQRIRSGELPAASPARTAG